MRDLVGAMVVAGLGALVAAGGADGQRAATPAGGPGFRGPAAGGGRSPAAAIDEEPAVRCGPGNRTYHFEGELRVQHAGRNEPLEGVQIRVVRANSPVRGLQGPDAVTDSAGHYDVDCTFARDRNGAVPGGNRVRLRVMARFRNDEFRVRRAGWARNNWFEVGQVRGCNRSGGIGTSECRDNDFTVGRTFDDASGTATRHAYMWWFFNDLQDEMEEEGIGLTDRPVFDRLLTVTHPQAGFHQREASHFLFNVHLTQADWDSAETMIHEFMHRWDIGKLGGEAHFSCLLDAHHRDPDDPQSTRCSGFMEGFAEATAEALEERWYGGNVDLATHQQLRSGFGGDTYPIASTGEAERSDEGWENFLELVVVDREDDAVDGALTCEPTDVDVVRMLEVLQQDASRKADWHEARPNATFAWFTEILEGHVSGFTEEDARIYQKLGDPSLSAAQVCDTSVAASPRHTLVVVSSDVSGGTRYWVSGGGDLEKRGGSLEDFSVTRQLGDEVNGNRVDGRVTSGNDGYIVHGRVPSILLENPGNAEVYVDGARYHTVVIASDDVSGATDYTLSGGGELHQRSGDLAGIEVTENAGDSVSGTTATGHVSSGNDGFVVLGDVPDISLSNPSGARVVVDGRER